MRPGPGLVVMALAFISGARRGSTSINSKTPSTPSESSSQSSFDSPSIPSVTGPLSGSIIAPTFLGGGGPLTTAFSLHLSQQREHVNKHLTAVNIEHFSKKPSSFSSTPNIINEFSYHHQKFHNTRKKTTTSLSSPPSSRAIRAIGEERSSNRALSYPKHTSSSDRAIIAHNTNNNNNSDKSDNSSALKVSSDNVSSSSTSFASSRATHYTRSTTENDIFTLIAEDDDLVSEEKILSLTEEIDDFPNNHVNIEAKTIHKIVANAGRNNSNIHGDKPQNHRDHHRPDSKEKRKVYASKLISNVATIAGDLNNLSAISNIKTLVTVTDRESVNIDFITLNSSNESPLTRLNPWISACDLAQPGTAPDLQGQCSAGTLPVAWVEEGPGPPSCPTSCNQLQMSILETSVLIGTLNNDYNNLMNENALLSNNNNNNNNNNHNYNINNSNKNSKQRFRKRWDIQEDTAITEGTMETMISHITTTTLRYSDAYAAADLSVNEMQEDIAAATAATMATTKQNINKNGNGKEVLSKNANLRSYNNLYFLNDELKYNLRQQLNSNKYEKHESNIGDEWRKQQQEQKQAGEKIQQCLDYLGDTDELSPKYLCNRELISPSKVAQHLRSLRLKHCCERNLFNALHTIALNATLNGGADCERVLLDIMELDSLATRITCELAEILFRFDCRQMYSLIHQCHDCKEAYRRWVCSTLIPYFAEADDILASIASTETVPNSQTATSDNAKLSNGHEMDISMVKIEKAAKVKSEKSAFSTVLSLFDVMKKRTHTDADTANIREKSIKRHILRNKQPIDSDTTHSIFERPLPAKFTKRSKQHKEFRKRKRIRPCLNVCQTVEQKCPYLLPADRAPALPTQYAGEPTFLCLDQNIPETGEQLRKSSYGPEECCYFYCGNVQSGVCTYCNDFFEESTETRYKNNTHRVHNITLTATTPHRLNSGSDAMSNGSSNVHARRVALALKDSDDDTAAMDDGLSLEQLENYVYIEGTYYYDDTMDMMPKKAISGDCPLVPTVQSRCTIPYYASGAASKRNNMRNISFTEHLLLWFGTILCLFTTYNIVQQHQYVRKHSRQITFTSLSTKFIKPNCKKRKHEYYNTKHNMQKRKQKKVKVKWMFGEGINQILICQYQAQNSTKGHLQNGSSINSYRRNNNNNNKKNFRRTLSIRISSNNTVFSLPITSITIIIFSEKRMRLRFKSSYSYIKMILEMKQKNIKFKSIDYSGSSKIKEINTIEKLRTKTIHFYSTVNNNYNKTNNLQNYPFYYHYNFNINDWWRRWWVLIPES